MSKDMLDYGIVPDLIQLAVQRAQMNRTTKGRVVPLSGNAEVYFKPKQNKLVLRPKVSIFTEELDQWKALKSCALEIKGKDFETVDDVYEALSECMAKHGFKSHRKKG